MSASEINITLTIEHDRNIPSAADIAQIAADAVRNRLAMTTNVVVTPRVQSAFIRGWTDAHHTSMYFNDVCREPITSDPTLPDTAICGRVSGHLGDHVAAA